MKLSSLHLDAFVPIPGFSSVDGHPKLEREKDFSEASGWDIRETTTGVFTVQHTSMVEPVTIGGYGYSYARLQVQSEPEGDPTLARGGEIAPPTAGSLEAVTILRRKGKR